jgi:hypothetical protein
MELRCPSCGNKHQSEDYPEAFEIQCSCGYSLLVPEIASEIQLAPQESQGFASAPGAVEAQDDAMKITMPNFVGEDPLLNIPKVDNALTPPEDLPEEMPYDPFELGQQSDSPTLPAAPHSELPLPESSQEMAFADAVFNETLKQQGGESLDAEIGELETASPAPHENPNADVDENAAPGQQIIQRAQLASLGQLLGASYRLKWSRLSSEQSVELQKRCEKIAFPRPWLMNELKRRGIDLETIAATQELDNVPELLALEIFTSSYEFGGSCEFESL